ncbi:CPBP family intramembrane glutamic endopeptidase [Cnuibacter sp. UC19_7]|uniref:CPBP family intramembrane glutamic endopeptidase n=1 Tax=Cnuibacter sp. UC19_7 TaxID=3350166 RepID=UPI00366FBC2D
MSDRPSHPRWGLVDAAAGVVAFAGVSLIVLSIDRLPGIAGDPRLQWGVDQVVAGWLPILAVVLVASYLRGRRSLGADFGLALRPLDLAIGLLAGILLRFGAVGIAEVVRIATGGPPVPFSQSAGSDIGWFLLTSVLAASIVTPVIEELYFRGLVLGALRNAVLGRAALTPGEVPSAASVARVRAAGAVAVLGSALLFTAFHLEGLPTTSEGVSRLVILFLVGVVLGSLALFTRRLGPSVVAHAVFNVSVAVLALLTPAASGLS